MSKKWVANEQEVHVGHKITVIERWSNTVFRYFSEERKKNTFVTTMSLESLRPNFNLREKKNWEKNEVKRGPTRGKNSKASHLSFKTLHGSENSELPCA